MKNERRYENNDLKNESTYRPVHLTLYLLEISKSQFVKRRKVPSVHGSAADGAAGRAREERPNAFPRFHPTAAGRGGGRQKRPQASSCCVSPCPAIAARAAAGHERMIGREPLRRCRWERNHSTRNSVPRGRCHSSPRRPNTRKSEG